MGIYINYNDINLTSALKNYLANSINSTETDRVVIDRAIDAAESEVNGYIGMRYDLPITNANETALLKSWAKKITIYNLYLLHPNNDIPEKWENEYNKVLTQLEKIGAGKLLLGMDTEDEVEEKQSMFQQYTRG
jgi:phage gp36-like protein